MLEAFVRPNAVLDSRPTYIVITPDGAIATAVAGSKSFGELRKFLQKPGMDTGDQERVDRNMNWAGLCESWPTAIWQGAGPQLSGSVKKGVVAPAV